MLEKTTRIDEHTVAVEKTTDGSGKITVQITSFDKKTTADGFGTTEDEAYADAKAKFRAELVKKAETE